jgi:glycosyltransferase involved in cell wall biosynthesis/UDP-N-acetyl-D-mannosaminuronic acid transferase (WecB/TagA/CpsF family)
VLHVINGEHYSGAERVQDLLAARLDEFGYEVDFACLKPGRFTADRHSQQARIFQLNMAGRFDMRPAVALARLVRARDYRLIHTHTPRAGLIGRLAAGWTGAPLVHHLHSPTTRDSTRSRRDAINAAVERWAMRGAAAVVAVSDSLAQYAVDQGVPRERIAVVANGVPGMGPLPPRTPPAGRWTLGCVALFRPRKGLESLLEAVALLRGDGHDVALRAVGAFETPGYENEVRRLVETLGLGDHVEWTGFSSNVPFELRRMDLFVLPSLFGEGMPMVVLEAMAAGTPIVATRVEGVPQAIRDGVDGLLAEPARPADLKRKVERFIRREVDWNRLRDSAHRRQAVIFSDTAMARHTADIYSRLTSRAIGAKTAADRVRLFGLDIDVARLPEAVERIFAWLRSPGPPCRFVVTPNVDHAVMFQENSRLRAAYEHASLVLADGMPVVLAARLLRLPLRERVAGSDLIPALFQATNEFGPLRTFLLGAGPGVAERAARNIAGRWPRVNVVGHYCPPLGFENDSEENERILAAIAASSPDLLIVGLGAPKQVRRRFDRLSGGRKTPRAALDAQDRLGMAAPPGRRAAATVASLCARRLVVSRFGVARVSTRRRAVAARHDRSAAVQFGKP